MPLRLPPQHVIVIKFVPNEYSFSELDEDLKNRYSSIYHIEEMNGTRRLHSRHIRMDIFDMKEYDNILKSGSITLGGMLCEVDEYLPAPKILICTKCNSPGHTKKVCRLAFERCRRCGEDRNVGEHQSCNIICHHCGDNHQATDYKCSTLLKFRRELIDQLRQNPDKLPPHIQMFIPFDCRIQKSEKVLTNQNVTGSQQSSQRFFNSNTSHEWPNLGKLPDTNGYEMQLNNFQKDLDFYKQKYQHEIEKINNRFHHYLNNIQSSCLMINSHIKTQKEIIESTSSIMNDMTFDMNTNVMNVITNVIQTINEVTTDDKTKIKLSRWQEEMKVQQKHLCEKHLAYIDHMQNLNELWLKQSNNIDESLKALDLLSPTIRNGQ